MTEEVRDKILENAKGPKRAQGDSGSIEQHDLLAQIEADRYLASSKAVKRGLGFKMTLVVSPGAA